MLVTIHTAAINGLDALHVFLEVSSTKGEGFQMVGLPDNAVRESGLRVFSALHNSGFHINHGHTTVNFAPADVRKEGSGYDLPLALGLMAASKLLPDADWSRWMFVGELGLDGSVRPVHGMLPVAIMLLPQPGLPMRIILCPPAAATSKARLTFSCPLTSAKSG